MRVRPATVEDCEAIGRGMKVVVEEGSWLATESATGATELAVRHRLAIEHGEPVFALEDEGEVVGALGLRPARAAGVLSLGMWILPSHRGRGGGRMLVDAGLAARPADVHKIELEVWPDNEAAIGLYRAMGFEREGLRRDHYRRQDGSLRSALIMARLFE
jgi:RimJ/RimL family protein N-acetyltransferase